MTNCPNYIICNNNLKDDRMLCLDCNMLFGKWRGFKAILDITDDTSCTICSEINICVSRPNCEHYLCIKCFKDLYFITSNKNIEDNKLSEYLEQIASYKKCHLC